MVAKKLKIIWSQQAILSLKEIYLYFKPKSLQGAKNVKKDILQTVKEIKFEKQYQIDEINPKYRRMIVRDYKILYLPKNKRIEIIDIVSTKRSNDYIEKL